jgi:2-oxoglutarate ferredoxin oxidoreductase subunit beta
VYVARWTALHVRRMTQAFKEAIMKPGFSFVEVIAPCSTLYARLNKLGTGLSLMKFYHDNSEIRHGADLNEINIDYQSKIVVGKFLDVEKPTYLNALNAHNQSVFGDKYHPYGGGNGND